MCFKNFSGDQSTHQRPSMEINEQTKSNYALLTIFTGCAYSPLLLWVKWITIWSVCHDIKCSYLETYIWFFSQHSQFIQMSLFNLKDIRRYCLPLEYFLFILVKYTFFYVSEWLPIVLCKKITFFIIPLRWPTIFSWKHFLLK